MKSPFKVKNEQRLDFGQERKPTIDFRIETEDGQLKRRKWVLDCDQKDPLIVGKERRRIHEIMKEKLGPMIPDTDFVVTQSDDGLKMLQMIQPEIDGLPADQAVEAGYIEADKLYELRKKISAKIDEVMWDERLEDLSTGRIKGFTCDPKNIIITKQGEAFITYW